MQLFSRSVMIGFLGWCLCAVIYAGEPVQNFSFGPYLKTIEGFAFPKAAIFDAAGRLYVADAGASRIRIYNKKGRLKRAFGTWGDGPKQLRGPAGLVLVDKELWVSDRGNHRLQVFSRRGRFRRTIEPKVEGLHLFRPAGLAYDAVRERIAVADTGNGRVLLLNKQGECQQIRASAVDGKGMLAPVAVAFDPEGVLYVIDRDANRIERFEIDGTGKPSWGGYGPFFGLLDEPSAAQWFGERLWVVDRRNHRIQGFHPEKGPLTLWGQHEIVPHSGGGKLHYPDILAIAPDGSKAIVGEAVEHRLQVFEGAENDRLIQEIAPTTAMRDRTHFGSYVSVAGGLLVVPEPENHFNFVFDLRRELPVIINKFGERGEGFGLLNRPAGLSLLPDRNEIVCLDAANRRLSFYRLTFDSNAPMRFDPHRVQFAWAMDFSAFEQHQPGNRKVDLRVVRQDRAGLLHVLDAANGAIFQVDLATTEISQVFPKKGASPFRHPTDLLLDPGRQRWLVADEQAGCIWAIDFQTGQPTALGKRGNHPGQLMRPFGIALSASGEILVTDSLRDRVLRFDDRGGFLEEWGGRGDRMGQFWNPKGIGVDAQGRIFVIDQGNHRAQIFSAEGAWLATFGAGRAYNARNVPKDKLPLGSNLPRGNSQR